MIDLKYQSKSNSNIYKWLTWNTKAKVIQTYTNDWLEIPKAKVIQTHTNDWLEIPKQK